MTDVERSFLVEKCGEILHRILVDIRALSCEKGNEKTINELAELAHNIPLFMVGRDDTLPLWIRETLIEHAKRRWPKAPPELTVCVQIWDMDDSLFQDRYRRYSFNGLVPETVAG